MSRPDRSNHGAMRQQVSGNQITGTTEHGWPPSTANTSSRYQPHGLYGFGETDPYQNQHAVHNNTRSNTLSETMHGPTLQSFTPARAQDNNGFFGYAQQASHHRNHHGRDQYALANQTPRPSTEDVLASDPFSMRVSWILCDLNEPEEFNQDGFFYRIEDFLKKDAREEYRKDHNKYDTYFRSLIGDIIDITARRFPSFRKSDYSDLGWDQHN